MSEYTPTTDEIRDDYAHMIAPHTAWGEDGFDAWLDRERAAARREGQAQAWDESAGEACGGNWLPDTNGNPGRPNLTDMKRRNPYRNEADQ